MHTPSSDLIQKYSCFFPLSAEYLLLLCLQSVTFTAVQRKYFNEKKGLEYIQQLCPRVQHCPDGGVIHLQGFFQVFVLVPGFWIHVISHIISSCIGTPPKCAHKNTQNRHYLRGHCVSVPFQISDMNVYL